MKELAARLNIAIEDGWRIEHTGLGCLALVKGGDSEYFMITDEDGVSIEGEPEAAGWIVGRYVVDAEGETKLVLANQPVTLAQAISLSAQIPVPIEEERIVTDWSELGVEIPLIEANSPHF